MPNIEIRGFQVPDRIKGKIGDCMRKIGLGEEAVTEIVRSEVTSCDGLNTSMPFLRIFSSEFHFIPRIIEAFSKDGVHEDIEVISEKMLFISKEEMKSGAWKEKLWGKDKYLLELALTALRYRLKALESEKFMGELKAVAEDNKIHEDEMNKLCDAVFLSHE